MARDDETFPGLTCSQLAWWGLTVAVEHLDAGLRLLADQKARGGPYFSAANHTVLRAALLGASQAAVLLLPAQRAVRTTYGLQLAHEEFRRARNLRKDIGAEDNLPADVRAAVAKPSFLGNFNDYLTRAAAALDERGVTGKSLSDTDLVRIAAGLVNNDHRDGGDARLLQLGHEMEWRLGSGSAHGQLLVSMHRPGGHTRQGDLAMFAGDYDDVAQTAGRILLTVNQAWVAWDARRRR